MTTAVMAQVVEAMDVDESSIWKRYRPGMKRTSVHVHWYRGYKGDEIRRADDECEQGCNMVSAGGCGSI